MIYILEAEDFNYLNGFQKEYNAVSSGQAVIRAQNGSSSSSASTKFQGETGKYSLKINYFDETDGESILTVKVDGKSLGTWKWDKTIGDLIATNASKTSRTLSNIDIKTGSIIELVGKKDKGEYLRIDNIEFVKNEPVSNNPLKIEAENFKLVSGFETELNAIASGGKIIKVEKNSPSSSASTKFQGETGKYSLKINYFDETDGVSTFAVKVDGKSLGTWKWDKIVGDVVASNASKATKIFSNVDIKKGSTIELLGQKDKGELLRIDNIEFVKNEPVKAFVGAEGFGSDTIGGRGGQIVHVTNLNDSGEGSLRWAVSEVKGPKIVVFDVEGVIELKKNINVNDPFTTIAGQTAPGEGIVIKGSGLFVRTEDVIIRGMKMRPGDGAVGEPGTIRDGISIVDGSKNVIVDHSSFTWGVDTNANIWGNAKNISFTNNIIAESLHDSIHIDEGKSVAAPHGMGMLIGSNGGSHQNITVAKNLFASNDDRNASINSTTNAEFINNYIYNYGKGSQSGFFGYYTRNEPLVIKIQGNVYEYGLDTKTSVFGSSLGPIRLANLKEDSAVYLKDNISDVRSSNTLPEKAIAHDFRRESDGSLNEVVSTPPFKGSDLKILSSDQVKAYVLGNAGARTIKDGWDVVDTRIINQVKNETTRIIDSQREVGGYGVYDFTGKRVIDTDRDGMPDWFEKQFTAKGFDFQKADDRLDYDKDGYTNIEEYINGLITGFDF